MRIPHHPMPHVDIYTLQRSPRPATLHAACCSCTVSATACDASLHYRCAAQRTQFEFKRTLRRLVLSRCCERTKGRSACADESSAMHYSPRRADACALAALQHARQRGDAALTAGVVTVRRT